MIESLSNKRMDFSPRERVEQAGLPIHLLTRYLVQRLDNAYEQYPALARVKTEENVLVIMAGALYDTSTILGLTVPPAEFFMEEVRENGLQTKAEIVGSLKDNTLLLRVELGFLAEQAHAFDPQHSDFVVDEINAVVAEEMYHAYVEKWFPRTDERTCLANEIGGKAYETDRGEKAAKCFASRYMSFRRAMAKKVA